MEMSALNFTNRHVSFSASVWEKENNIDCFDVHYAHAYHMRNPEHTHKSLWASYCTPMPIGACECP